MFKEKVQRLLRYAAVFLKDYGIRFVDVYIMDIVEDPISSNILAAKYRSTHIRYITVGTMIV